MCPLFHVIHVCSTCVGVVSLLKAGRRFIKEPILINFGIKTLDQGLLRKGL